MANADWDIARLATWPMLTNRRQASAGRGLRGVGTRVAMANWRRYRFVIVTNVARCRRARHQQEHRLAG